MATSEELRQAYLATELVVEIDPDVWLPIEQVGAIVPTPLHVLTAWNPASEPLSMDENQRRMEQLQLSLAGAGRRFWRAVGSSPDGEWSEEMFAVAGLDRIVALAFGREFGQNAIFEIDLDTLHVVSCDGSWIDARELNRAPTGLDDSGSTQPNPSGPRAN